MLLCADSILEGGRKNTKVVTLCKSDDKTELQIRESIEDNSKIIVFISERNICCDPSLEPSQRDGSNDGSQNMFSRRNMANYP